MQKVFLLIASLFILKLYSQTQNKSDQNKIDISLVMDKMLDHVHSIKTAKYILVKNERCDGRMVKTEQLVKQTINPMKVYLKLLKGLHRGTELLFVKGTNGDKALLNSGSFIPTVSLSPFSPILKENQRHTIYELGFVYTGNIIYDTFKRLEKSAVGIVKYEGIALFDGHECYKVMMDNIEYKLTNHSVLVGEDLIKIARKLKLDEYSLLEYNRNVKDYTDVKSDQVIKVPNSFCKIMEVYIDVKTLLPIYQKMYDLNGLVAEYEYYNLQINLTIPDVEFTKDFEDYGF